LSTGAENYIALAKEFLERNGADLQASEPAGETKAIPSELEPVAVK
jgi:hypothetical protein